MADNEINIKNNIVNYESNNTDFIELENKKNESQEINKKLQKLLILNSIFYLAVFFVIGLPIWYLTTSTYRAPLPFSEIDDVASMLLNNQIEFKFDFEFIHLKENRVSNDLNEKFQTEMNKEPLHGISFSFSSTSRFPNQLESDSFKSIQSLKYIDEKLKNQQNINTLKIYVLDQEQAKKFSFENSNFIFLNNLYVKNEYLTPISKLANHLKANYLRIKQLTDSFQVKLDNSRKLTKKDELKVTNFDSEYEITFSLINSNPENFDSNWNIQDSILNYFNKISGQLTAFVDFKIKTQTLLYCEFDSYKFSSQIKNNKIHFYHIKQNDLSIMTNYIESRLSSRITNSSGLDFVIYVPPVDIPVYILSREEKNETQVKSNAFLVPRWGGIYIYNPTDSNNEKSINTKEAMRVFITQFLDLIGINLNKNTQEIVRTDIYTSEIFSYLTFKTLENLLSSINTLKSISLLLNKINNMVINDDVASKIIQSLKSIKKCLDYISDGKIVEAFYSSKIAFKSSEKAFFDPSLLEKLYFPDDQTFAIYIPLFIPVAIPLLLSVKSIRIWLTKCRKEQKLD